jgi:hypothetical protein
MQIASIYCISTEKNCFSVYIIINYEKREKRAGPLADADDGTYSTVDTRQSMVRYHSLHHSFACMGTEIV